MLSFMVDCVLIMVIDSDASLELRENLAEMFMSQSKARYMPLKIRVQTTKKGALSIANYFQLISLCICLLDWMQIMNIWLQTYLLGWKRITLLLKMCIHWCLAMKLDWKWIREKHRVKCYITCLLILLKKDLTIISLLVLIREVSMVEILVPLIIIGVDLSLIRRLYVKFVSFLSWIYKCRNIFNQNFIPRPWRSGLRPRGVINYKGLVILKAVTTGDLVFLMVLVLFFLNSLEMDFYFKAMLPIKALISCLLKAILTFKDHQVILTGFMVLVIPP